jgi:two-component system OmpR family sensor kinase
VSGGGPTSGVPLATDLRLPAGAAQPQPGPSPCVDLAQRLSEAEAAVRARDDFLAIAAHELRSPMNALSLQLAVLERRALLAPAASLSGELGRLRRTLDRYVRGATVLLDVTRLNADAPRLVCRAVDVRELVDAVVDAHRDEAEFRGATLTADVDGDIVGCWDPHMVEQVLVNLVNNAIKYGGGTPVRVAARAGGGQVRFEVSDRGPGIEASQRPRIFGKFERIVAPTTYQSGFGLGLWIVGRMVQAHHGTIDLHSEPGMGSVFVVTLPLDSRTPPERPAP